MELEELKQKWEVFDMRLTQSEIYNKQILKETLKGKNKSYYSKLNNASIFHFFSVLFLVVIFIAIYFYKNVYHDVSFYLLMSVLALTLIMIVRRLTILSRFNVTKSPASQLRNLIHFKQWYVCEMVIGVPIAFVAVLLTLYIENATSPIGIAFAVLGIIAGCTGGWIGWKQHNTTMQEIEENLKSLKEFEEE